METRQDTANDISPAEKSQRSPLYFAEEKDKRNGIQERETLLKRSKRVLGDGFDALARISEADDKSMSSQFNYLSAPRQQQRDREVPVNSHTWLVTSILG
jgi:hypothetical protein